MRFGIGPQGTTHQPTSWNAKHYTRTAKRGGNRHNTVHPENAEVTKMELQHCCKNRPENIQRSHMKREEEDMNNQVFSLVETKRTGEQNRIKALEKPKTIVLPSSRARNFRPSLTQQLRSIAQAAENVTTGILERHGDIQAIRSGCLFTVPSQSFRVGKLESRFPSPVHVFRDRCEYVFHHPFETSQIKMVMYFKDMTRISTSRASRKFRFKIDHLLHHYLRDYDPRDENHFVEIIFASGMDLDRVRSLAPFP